MYSELLNYAIKSIGCLAFFYLFYAIILQNETCFRFNRGYLLLALLFAFVLPLLKFSVQLSEVSPIDPNVFILPEVIITDSFVAQTNQFFDLLTILNIVYLIIATFLTFRLVKKLYMLWKVINSNRHLREEKYIYTLIPTNGKMPTASFLDYLFWDDSIALNKHEQRQIISHEKVHILERHSYDVLLIELLSIVFWFNPFVWLWKKAIVENHEYLADAQASGNPDDYSAFLARHTLELNGFKFAHQFKSAEVIKRIQMLNKMGQKTRLTKLMTVIPLVAFMTFTMSFSIEHVIDQPTFSFTPITSQNVTIQTPHLKDETSNRLPQRPEQQFTSVLKHTNLPLHVETKPIEKVARSNKSSSTQLSLPKEEVFNIVEESAKPAKGMSAFYAYVAKRMKYPKQAKKENVQGRVYVEFIVDKDGELTNIKIIKGIGAGCDEEALRVLTNTPKWLPAKQEGKRVKQKIVLPIAFKLG